MKGDEVAKRKPHWRPIAGAAVALVLGAGGCGNGHDVPSDIAGGASTTPASGTVAISSANCAIVEGSDRLTVAVSLVDELLRTEAVFRDANPGSPAQFRARESADELRYRLETLVGRRCLSKDEVREPNVP